jgi:hypothetical protein
MPFFKAEDIDDLDAYKKTRNASLSRIGEKPASFVFSKKHTFKSPPKKVQPIFIFENGKIDAALLKAIKAATSGQIAEGTCFKNKEGVLIFDLTKGDLDGFDMVPKFQIGPDVEKASDAAPKAEAAIPEAPPKAEPLKAASPKTEAPKAPPPPPAPPEEEEEEDKDFKVRLMNGLKKVKLADGKESIAFVACVAKPFYGVLLAKNPTEKIGAPHKKVLTELTQGNKFIVGNCVFEQNAYTFVVESVPGGLAKKLKLALKEFTGQNLKVRVRDAESKLVADGDTEVDPEEEQAAAAPKATVPPTPPPPPPVQAKTTAPKAEAAEAQQRDIKLSTYLSGRANLRSAREMAEKALQGLQSEILARCKDEPFYPEVEAKSRQLFDFLTPIDDTVADKLDEAGRCTDPERQAELNKHVRALIQKQLTAMRNHPLSSFVGKNPFGKFKVKEPLETTLSALDRQLS